MMNVSAGYVIGMVFGMIATALIGEGRWRSLLGGLVLAVGLLIALWVDAQNILVGFVS